MAALPWRLGSAKVVWPFPPYIVPSSENNAVFWLMLIVCPLHIAQPFGGKLNANIEICPRNTSLILLDLSSSGPGRSLAERCKNSAPETVAGCCASLRRRLAEQRS